MSKLNPKNREEAFGYQIQDDARILTSLGALQVADNNKEFVSAIERLESTIATYRRLSKAAGK